MIHTRPAGNFENIQPAITKAKSNMKKVSNKSESDKSPSPKKEKISSVSLKNEKTSAISPIKSSTSLSVLKQTLDTNHDLQEVNLN